jgi:Zn-dependent M28 family amino/carboxypeptidase
MPKKRFAIKFITRAAIFRLAILAAVLTILSIWFYYTMLKMPEKSYRGPLPPLTADQIVLRDQLRRDVETLASDIGERNIFNLKKLALAADFIEAALAQAGYKTTRQSYKIENDTFTNIEAQITGATYPDQIVVIGAHYDTVYGSPGANDNASAVAANLALARHFANQKMGRTLRFVFFTNEEAPFYHSEQMGSFVYAKSCKQKNENITAMLSLETIGYYTSQPKSQSYPQPFSLFYPSTGNFLGFVSNTASKKLLRRAIASFRKNCKFPSEGGALPEFIPGIAWSDHWSFWQHNYPAIMLTDTAPFRYPYYHSPSDTPDKLCYDELAIVTSGIESVITDLMTSDL